MVVFMLLFGGIGAVVTAVGVAYLRGYWRVRRTDPTDAVAVSPEQDVVELTGTAHPVGEPYRAPFSDADALLCEWSVERHDTTGDGSSWREIDSDQAFAPFRLDDGTDETIVDPNGAEWTLQSDFTVETEPDSRPPLEIRRYLEETPFESLYRTDEDERRTDKRRYRERRLDAGSEVYVYGPVQSGPIRGVPETEGEPVVSSDRAAEERAVSGRATTFLTPGIVPGVGEPEETFSLGAADESVVFVVADGGEASAQRRLLKRGLAVTAIGLVLFLFPLVAVLFGESSTQPPAYTVVPTAVPFPSP
jgi:hypothetical protein